MDGQGVNQQGGRSIQLLQRTGRTVGCIQVNADLGAGVDIRAEHGYCAWAVRFRWVWQMVELWHGVVGSRDVLELVEVSQRCYSPASLQALE